LEKNSLFVPSPSLLTVLGSARVLPLTFGSVSFPTRYGSIDFDPPGDLALPPGDLTLAVGDFAFDGVVGTGVGEVVEVTNSCMGDTASISSLVSALSPAVVFFFGFFFFFFFFFLSSAEE
jgi:hypothetical protein